MAVNIVEGHSAAHRIGHFRIDTGRGKKRIVATRVELEDGLEPGNESRVVELCVWQRIATAEVE